MPLTTVVDVERLVSDYLRAHADIVALGARVVGDPPPGDLRGTPWVQVTELDAPQQGNPDHLVESMMQFDCYAGANGTAMGGQPGANALARAVRAVLGTLPGQHALGVVTGVHVMGGPRNRDTDMEPARNRKILTAVIWTHA